MPTPHRIDLPALVGTEPLGFLAAVGLLDQLLGNDYLCWDPQDHHAVVYSEKHSSIADLVAVLSDRLNDVRPGNAIPFTSGFPVHRRRGAPDPLRVRPAEYRDLLQRVSRSSGGMHWLEATVTTGATDADGFCAVNPLVAVRGRQTIGSFWYYPMLEVRQDPHRLLTEALARWHRVEGAEGWLLDHRATYSADPGLRGPGGSMAVPGATWLATLAVAQFGYGERHGAYTGGPALSAGWFRVGDRDVFLWPLWTLPVGCNTLDAVWSVGWRSGDWNVTPRRDGTLEVSICKTHGVVAPNGNDHTVDFGITDMFAAVRSADGPLTPVRVRTTRRRTKPRECEQWKGWDWQYPDLGIKW